MTNKFINLIALVFSLVSFQIACAQSTTQNSSLQQNQIDWTVEKPDVPKGKVESFTIRDNQYNRARKVWVYTPPNYDANAADAYHLLISFDGEDYIKDIPAPVILDNLLADGRIYPIVQVFVDNSEDRLGDLANHQKFADFAANDLLPWVQKNFHVTNEAEKRALAGYSAGGLGAVYAAFCYPNLFGNIFSQSGAFWRGNEGTSTPSEWLTTQLQTAEKLPVKFYLEVGGSENIKNAVGLTMIETSRHLRDVLKEKGYKIGYAEIPKAVHNPEHWRNAFADGIIFIFGKPAK